MGYLNSSHRRAQRISLALIAGVMLVWGGWAGEASAIEDAPAWSYAMAHDLMSPFCPGRTLAECPSPQATELRFWILTQAAAGASETEVNAMLTDRFGDVLLAAPRAEGWGLSAYVIPIAFFVIGGPVVVLIIRRLTSKGSQGKGTVGSAADSPPEAEPGHAGTRAPDPELERQLEIELEEF
ncbi:MAG: cytochrome c-type biogenesis protein CcmH [Deltaproteobacteria bacterium]|nr:cytochrome c-type biogenesis protein CcmH [Deltaproteobacteria bacterium]MBW2387427.1 cytochrome c-type biogenesis protein CcmH [Deltaproteobacteria bacterium]